MSCVRLFPLLVAATLFAGGAAHAEWSLVEGAQVHPPYRGDVPARSDVVFSTRFESKEAPELIRAFGATRVEWVYTDEKAYVQTILAVAPWFGGAIKTAGKTLGETMITLDFDGKPTIVAHMRQWGGQLLSTTAPASQEYMLSTARQLVGWGAKSIHFDNPQLQYNAALFLGGDFNPATLAGFPKFLAAYPDQNKLAALGLRGFSGDYRDFVKAKYNIKGAADYNKQYKKLPSNPIWLAYVQSTVAERYLEFRQKLDQGRPKPIPVSMNLSNLYEPNEADRYFFLGAVADYAIAETHVDELPRLLSQMATARAIGLGFVSSIRPLTLPENRAAVATLYALGSQPVVPWDVYSGNEADGRAKRYYGTTDEFGDLYKFVRANRPLFDGLESAAMVGIPVPVDNYLSKETKALIEMLAERQIPFAFVAMGGTTTRYTADVARLKHFKVLATPNPDSDFSAADLKLLNASKVERVTPEALRKGLLNELQPFFAAPGGETLKLYARANPGDPTRLVVHLVDAASGPNTADAACKRRVGISNKVLDPVKVSAARWVTPTGAVDVKADVTARGTFMTLPGCPLWGMVELRLAK